MSDEKTVSANGTSRPNANYKLSIPDDVVPEEGLHFYYNRQRRLAKAPQAVQDLYKEQKKTRFGLFGVLVADRPRRMLFVSIILLCVLIIVLSRMGFFDNKHILDGNRIEITGIGFEGTTIVNMRKTVEKKDAYTGAVNIAISVETQQQEQYPVFYHRVFFTLEKEEAYRFAVPFDSPELLIVLQSEKSNLQFKFAVE